MNHVQSLGHAGLLIEYNGIRLVCDPWFSKTGAFLASWHQYPKNDFLSDVKPTHLYISHKHGDHFDPDYLKTLNKRIPVILPDHPSRYLERQILELGFYDVRVLSHFESLSIAPDCGVSMILDTVPYLEDSALMVDLDGFKILDMNDAKINEETCRKITGADLLFMQFSGAQYYPVAYEYSLEQKQLKVEEFRKSLHEQYRTRLRWLKPKKWFPSAGPPCFPERMELNFDSIFPDQRDFFGATMFDPGDWLRIPRMDMFGGTIPVQDKRDYLKGYARERKPIIRKYLGSIDDRTNFTELAGWLHALCARSPFLTQRINAVIEFDLGDFRLFADFLTGELHCWMDGKPNYTMKVENKYLAMVVHGKILFEDLLLSMRYSLRRNPDVYNWPFFALMRFGYSESLLRIIEQISKESYSEFITKGRYTIQRYCPHAGEDLTNAKVDGDVLTCPRHGWQFDLRTGACISGGNQKLKVLYEENVR